MRFSSEWDGLTETEWEDVAQYALLERLRGLGIEPKLRQDGRVSWYRTGLEIGRGLVSGVFADGNAAEFGVAPEIVVRAMVDCLELDDLNVLRSKLAFPGLERLKRVAGPNPDKRLADLNRIDVSEIGPDPRDA